jgi:putative transposase
MAQLSYCRHRFPASIIQHTIWLYLRFTLAVRGLDISYETVRRWVLKFERQQAEVRFARDSPLEGDGFEPSVPP